MPSNKRDRDFFFLALACISLAALVVLVQLFR
jgi:hypothetical protein